MKSESDKKMIMKYEVATDDELIQCYRTQQDGNALAVLYRRYNHMIRAVGQHYFLLKAEDEDLLQEGRLGFYKAVQGYELKREAPFSAFAKRCVRCQYISAIKAANRQKHRPLNTSVSLNATIHLEDSEVTFLDILADETNSDAADSIIQMEEYRVCHAFVRQLLSEVEYEAVMCYLKGSRYEEIAHSMGRSVKSIDNALQRAKQAIRLGVKTNGEITLKMLRQYFRHCLCYEEAEDPYEIEDDRDIL